jgi:predicted RNase H-like HicB family nuclease
MLAIRKDEMEELKYIQLTMVYHKEDGQWVGECKELGTSAFGDSIEEVETELAELVELHLNTLEELNEREKFFKEQGITIITKDIPKTFNVSTPYIPGQLIQPCYKTLLFA